MDESNPPPPKCQGWTDEQQQMIRTYFTTSIEKQSWIALNRPKNFWGSILYLDVMQSMSRTKWASLTDSC